MMFRMIVLLVSVSMIPVATLASEKNPQARIITSMGEITLELNADAAPETVNNFLTYASGGFYDNTVFHRVIKGFMIQGGGMSEDLQQKTTKSPIRNEADNGLKNLAGTIAMARTPDPHSATSQFFINTVDNPPLDFRNKSRNGWGYCVFGKVVDGMQVVKAIENMETTTRSGYADVPVKTVRIKQVLVTEK